LLLVADSGSTKTDWILAGATGQKLHLSTIGYNPYFISSEEIHKSIAKDLLPKIGSATVEQIFFYGAGCSVPEKKNTVAEALKRSFPKASISVDHDLLGASRALLGNTRGFAAILGTGSNTCIYNGKEIELLIDSLGYLLGDEGSGCYIGKQLVRDFMRSALPADLQSQFFSTYKLSSADIFDSMYNKPLPNRFLAGFCRFANENKDHTYIRHIIDKSFSDFFTNLVSKYPGYKDLSFNCVGSVGYQFSDQLSLVAERFGMKTGKLIPAPIQDLVSYHTA